MYEYSKARSPKIAQTLRLRRPGRLQGLPRKKAVNYAYYNPNPEKRSVGDCAVRAISKALGQSWDETYVGLCLEGFRRKDWGNADSVWGQYLKSHGFVRRWIPDKGQYGCTVEDFAGDHPTGTFILSMPGRHVLAVEDGVIYDSWDSRNEIPTYFWEREQK